MFVLLFLIRKKIKKINIYDVFFGVLLYIIHYFVLLDVHWLTHDKYGLSNLNWEVVVTILIWTVYLVISSFIRKNKNEKQV